MASGFRRSTSPGFSSDSRGPCPTATMEASASGSGSCARSWKRWEAAFKSKAKPERARPSPCFSRRPRADAGRRKPDMSPQQARAVTEGRRILIVEDDGDLREALSQILRDEGYD